MAAAKAPMDDIGALLGGGPKAGGAKAPPAPAMDEEMPEDDGITPAFRAAGEEYLDALDAGDRETALTALKRAIVECVETHTAGEY